ncbi:hypothetical protein STCU_10664 [Strigomonas culicis]|uniref:Uncharacterized protein n=1 Tax=Strigomonas culicis TaxID=28005 RepID=S9URY4_9TRYP|nr:hypothetical protein STCU_10664 [Strigomonas culicis]|eukprot:EPY17366.1 hypothetical protein STCU_10664 [Strigomonas culicis]
MTAPTPCTWLPFRYGERKKNGHTRALYYSFLFVCVSSRLVMWKPVLVLLFLIRWHCHHHCCFPSLLTCFASSLKKIEETFFFFLEIRSDDCRRMLKFNGYVVCCRS